MTDITQSAGEGGSWGTHVEKIKDYERLLALLDNAPTVVEYAPNRYWPPHDGDGGPRYALVRLEEDDE